MNPWIPHLLRAGGGGGGPVLPPAGRTMLANLKSSLILDEGIGDPTWSRATKAWGFNELGYLVELASGCAFFGGARLVRNAISTKSEDVTDAAWGKTGVTTPSADVVVCSAATTSQNIFNNNNYLQTTGSSILAKVRLTYINTPIVQLRVGGNINSAAYANFDILNGTYVLGGAGAIFASISPVSSGVYDCIFVYTVTGTSADTGLIVQFVNNIGSGRASVFTGDGVKSFGITRAQLNNVTGYPSSYVPEYVSVGVVPSPFFGAGIDGAKYFETDWQGAPIAAANLLKVRREASAINNLLRSRSVIATPTSPTWIQTDTTGGDYISNGDFSSDVSWLKSTGCVISGGNLTFTARGASIAAQQTNGSAYISGIQYVLTYTVVSNTLDAGGLRCGGFSGSSGFGASAISLPSAAGTYSFTLIGSPTGAGTLFDIWINSPATSGTLVLDDISIKQAKMQCTLTATGLDGIANTATTLTATAADAIILQPIALASAARCASAYVKRRTGTGAISFTQDGGSTWTDITSQINSSTWSRVQITATLANPSVGFKISTSGDAIDVDCVQNEAGAEATSPIVTTTATITRNADSLSYQTAGNIDFSVGTLYGEIQTNTGTATRYIAWIGTSYSGLIDTALTSWRAYDGTTIANQTGLSNVSSAKRKRVVSWGGLGLASTGDGRTPAISAFDGSFGDGATIAVGTNANGYVGPVAIYNYQMTDAELQAITV